MTERPGSEDPGRSCASLVVMRHSLGITAHITA